MPKTPFQLLAPELLAAILSFLLLVYSVLIEIPLAKRRRRAPSERDVVSAGFYGIVRHPGFLWFVFFWASLMVIYHNGLVALVGVCLVLLDLALVCLEDRVFFPRIFTGYEAYKRQVPFLVPALRRKTNDVQL